MPVTIEDIRAAAAAIAGGIVHTPCMHSRTLSEICGARLFLKLENLQYTASFKERGALNKLLALSAAERRAGVIAMSAGNHAQAVAFHATALGIALTGCATGVEESEDASSSTTGCAPPSIRRSTSWATRPAIRRQAPKCRCRRRRNVRCG